MKLNTKDIFEASSLKVTPKLKAKIIKKSKGSSPYTKENKFSKNKLSVNSTLKQKLFRTSNKKVNPFTLISDKNQEIKNPKPLKISASKKVKINLDIIDKNDDLFEDSYINNLALTSESDTNENNKESKMNKDIKDTFNLNRNQNEQNELGINDLCELFKKSILKSTIIVDDNGNNNLDFEQKKIIDNYFNKKANPTNNKKTLNNNNFKRQRIRKITTQIYKDNNVLFNRLCHTKCSTNDHIEKTSNLNLYKKSAKCNANKKIIESYSKNRNRNISNNFLEIKEHYFGDKNKNNFDCKIMKSTKLNAFILIDDVNDRNLLIDKEENEKNSIFENNSSFSLDSSFLGSSLDDDFYKNFKSN